MTHGYVFAFNTGGFTVVPQGGLEAPTVRQIGAPLPEAAPSELVMLGDHSHALLIAGQVFHSTDLGLTWTPLYAPEPIQTIAPDADGDLLAAGDGGLRTWQRVRQTWSAAAPLPEHDAPILRVFKETLYALVGGQLYRRAGGVWQPVAVPDGGYLTALEFQYPATLWALDAAGRRVLSSTDGAAWSALAVKIPLG